MPRCRLRRHVQFQSTLPVWGATIQANLIGALIDISIHAPRVGSDVLSTDRGIAIPISIHAPRVGSDAMSALSRCVLLLFQSTLPVWGATLAKTGMLHFSVSISIHAPRVGSDCFSAVLASMEELFQSTLPVWGATVHLQTHASKIGISIHAPRVGSDQLSTAIVCRGSNFNPRSPCGERPPTAVE